MDNSIIDSLAVPNTTKIVLLVMDGVGGCPAEPGGPTELQAASTPNLDELASRSDCGLLDPIFPGVTPGSGPAHLGLFGYDPLACNIGRGILSALGVNFALRPGDVAARVNFASVDASGAVTDRRAGRISTTENGMLCRKLRERVSLGGAVEFFIEPEKEHRAVLVFRGEGLDEAVGDTDPQVVGQHPLAPRALRPAAEHTARAATEFLRQAASALADEPRANMLLLRGFSSHHHLPSISERFGMRSLALAVYPMYKGLAKLVGMEVVEGPSSLAETVVALRDNLQRFDFVFLHYKDPDGRGEDGDFAAKVRAIEDFDAAIPGILALEPAVLAVTGDHSTPAVLKGHSWQPVPVLVSSPWARAGGVTTFDEIACARGSLGRMPAQQLMGVLLACALRLKKFGA